MHEPKRTFDEKVKTVGGAMEESIHSEELMLLQGPELEGLARTLQAVAANLAPAQAQRAFAQLLPAIEKTTLTEQLGALARALKAVPANIAAQTLIDSLKRPTSVGAFRTMLLEILERQTHQQFDGNLWKMVTWAQAHGLDVRSPPKRPGK